VRYRVGRHLLTADISNDYKATRMRPEHLKFKKYLWRDNM
jgi:hypothetical protein